MAKAAHYDPSVESDNNPGRAIRVGWIIVAIIAGLILACYAVGAVYFSGHLWPNTSAEGVDLSLMSEAQAKEALDARIQSRVVSVTGDGVSFTLNPEQAGLTLDTQKAVSDMRDEISPLLWPVEVLSSHDTSETLLASYDLATIEDSVTQALASYNESATDPVDASVAYSEEEDRYVVSPGSAGTKINPAAVAKLLIQALQDDRISLAITDSCYVQQSITADDPGLQAAAASANAFLTANFDLTINDTVVDSVGPDLVNGWIVFGEDGSAEIDTAMLAAWVDELEGRIDNVGASRSYTRPDGKYVTVPAGGGAYGWITDGNAIEELVLNDIQAGFVGSEEIPMKQTAAVYNPGGQDWGTRYIDVDLSEQHVVFYGWDGSIIWQSDCISGAPYDNRETPQGVYYITNKALNQTLIGLPDPVTGEPLYETPVTYWMPFVGNAVGLHDASWQPAFGGTLYQSGYGSHGCVNLPSDAAATLYSIIQIGDVVVVHY